MKNKSFKSLITAFALALTMVATPIAAMAAASSDCKHTAVTEFMELSRSYHFYDYSQHIVERVIRNECNNCLELLDPETVREFEGHGPINSEGMCICGTYVD